MYLNVSKLQIKQMIKVSKYDTIPYYGDGFQSLEQMKFAKTELPENWPVNFR